MGQEAGLLPKQTFQYSRAGDTLLPYAPAAGPAPALPAVAVPLPVDHLLERPLLGLPW